MREPTEEELDALASQYELTATELREHLRKIDGRYQLTIGGRQFAFTPPEDVLAELFQQPLFMRLPAEEVRQGLRAAGIPEPIISEFLRTRPAPLPFKRGERLRFYVGSLSFPVLFSRAFWRGLKRGYMLRVEERAK